MRSGIYFVHYDDIDAFLYEAEKSGRSPLVNKYYAEEKKKKYKNSYRAFSLDGGEGREDDKSIGIWKAYPLWQMKNWSNWAYTEKHIEHWQRKKVIL